ncbi:MAG: sigma 54-interacting transcriptional regulator [Synergistaceae bacterium]|nr:sigma 54-interacting transcriptional regulator [Synergistaceae bacterium]
MNPESMRTAWETFINEGRLSAGVRDIIASSWIKCARNMVDPSQGFGRFADEGMFESIMRANTNLINIAVPIMANLAGTLSGSHFTLVLTDNCGYILEIIGDELSDLDLQCLRFRQGTRWTCDEVGTNAIGLALETDNPIQTAGAEHFCEPHHGWICSAAPIHGANGEIIGCVDISGKIEVAPPHSLGIIHSLALAIESVISQRQESRMMHAILENSRNCVLLLDDDCHCVWLNKRGMDLFGAPDDTSPIGADMRKILLGVDWETVKRMVPVSTECALAFGGRFIDCFAEISPIRDEHGCSGYSVSIRLLEQIIERLNALGVNRAYITFDIFEPVDEFHPGLAGALRTAKSYARYDGHIMIEGESGTGKNIFAQAIHNGSRRASRPFVTVECSSFPRRVIEVEIFGCERHAFHGVYDGPILSRFEMAEGGTIFLNDVDALPLGVQRKLVNCIRDSVTTRVGGTRSRSIDVRVITSTSRDLRQDVKKKLFSRELYALLSSLKLELPPLRERKSDICSMTRKFLGIYNENYPGHKKVLRPDAIQALESYHWPDNTRELLTVVEQAFFSNYDDMSGVISASSLPAQITEGRAAAESVGVTSLPEAYERFERSNIETALRNFGGDAAKAASALGISRASLYRKMKNLGINTKIFRSAKEA